MEPGADQVTGPDGCRLANQHQEGGLEDVFGVMVVAENPPADSQHHWPMANYQALKGGLVMPFQERLQQLSVAEAIART
jgi:hypothetical protein